MNGNSIYPRIGTIPRDGGFRRPGYRIWGSSVVVGEDGLFHMFASRIPEGIPFHPGWMIASEIVHAVSDTPGGPYRFVASALPPRGAAYWDGRSTHNPRVVKHGGKYVLYYTGSTHPFEDVTPENAKLLTLDSKWCVLGRANKRIGIAVADSPYGPWTRMDRPALETKPATFYSFLTSNPAPAIDPSGKAYLIFKSRRYEGNRHGEMMIGLATADHYLGPYQVVNTEPLFSETRHGVIEDPFLWINGDGFHLIAKDQHGTITGEHGAGALFHSANCLDWTPDADVKAYTRDIVWEDGARERLANMERCSLLFDADGTIRQMFFAVWIGSRGFGDETPESRAWNMAVPLS